MKSLDIDNGRFGSLSLAEFTSFVHPLYHTAPHHTTDGSLSLEEFTKLVELCYAALEEKKLLVEVKYHMGGRKEVDEYMEQQKLPHIESDPGWYPVPFFSCLFVGLLFGNFDEPD